MNHQSFVGTTFACVLILAASSAAAQDPAPAPPPAEPLAQAQPPVSAPNEPPPPEAAPRGHIDLGAPPRRTIDLSTPPPTRPAPRKYHMHDGFYARASVGFGSLGATFDDDDPTGLDLKGSGPALSVDVMVWGSPSPGLAIGGGLIWEASAAVSFDRGGFRDSDRSLGVTLIGPFIDGFPVPNRGWHFGGLIGVTQIRIEDTNADRLNHANGVGGAFWVGDDFWVGDEWSIGPLLRLSGALTNRDDPDVHASSFALTLLFTAIYH